LVSTLIQLLDRKGGFVRDLRPHLFVGGDRPPLRRKCMFASSDHTVLPADCKSLTSADIPPLAGATEPQPQTAVSSHERSHKGRPEPPEIIGEVDR
jgi:hypothetical protein